MTNKNGKTIYLQTVTMKDSATGWIEICTVPPAHADLVELSLFTRYPLSSRVIIDRVKEFLAEFKTMILSVCGIEENPITSSNPQANSILDRFHQAIGNIIRAFKVKDMVFDDENPWNGILECTMFTLRAMVHTTKQNTPTNLSIQAKFNFEHRP